MTAPRPDPACATCLGTGETPCGMSLNGTNARPARINYGPCPTCRDGDTCPRCLYRGGMDDDDENEPKCRFCGWSAKGDRQNAKSEDPL